MIEKPKSRFLTKVNPQSPIVIWKLHRFVLKAVRPWFVINLPSLRQFTIRFFAEGKSNLVFQVKDDSRLLRITLDQYYDLTEEHDTLEIANSSRLMNSMAEANIAPSCEYLGGGACLVEYAGVPVTQGGQVKREQIRSIFASIKAWSLQEKISLTDFNENNWCMLDDKLLFVDVEFKRMVPLGDLRSSFFVQRRVNVEMYKSNEEILDAYLSVEEEMLWNSISSKSNFKAEHSPSH